MFFHPVFRGIPLIIMALAVFPALATVELYLVPNGEDVELRYRCTGGEQVRFFNLDVRVSKGTFTAVTPALRGESTATNPGYGIFPSAFRDHLTVDGNGEVNWEDPDYLPVAPASDAPSATLAGLGSAGVTLEFGTLWNVNRAEDVPPAEGLLCTLTLSEPSLVTVEANSARGGVVLADGSPDPAVTFQQLDLTPSRITGILIADDMLMVNFEGGELFMATDLEGAWAPTGDTSGEYVISFSTAYILFFRVEKP